MGRRLIIDLTVPRDPKVVFEGGYVTRVELGAVLRGIKRHTRSCFMSIVETKLLAITKLTKRKKRN